MTVTRIPAAASLAMLVIVPWLLFSQERSVAIVVQGLTLASLFYLVAIGLSLVYGLGNVLNLAHTGVFMFGAFVAGSMLVNPGPIIGLVTVGMAIIAGHILGRWTLIPTESRLKSIEWARSFLRLARVAVMAGLVAMALLGLEAFGALAVPPEDFSVPAMTVVIALFLLALILEHVEALLTESPPRTDPTSHYQRRVFQSLVALGLLAACVAVVANGERLESWLRSAPSNWIFITGLLVASVFGTGIGWLIEARLVRPLKNRHIPQIVITFFALIAMMESARLIFGPTTMVVPRPGMFAASGPTCDSVSFVGAFLNSCATVDIFGSPIATYRVAIVVAGFFVMGCVFALLRWSRIGITVRAGVENSEMAQALGVNVSSVMRLVFLISSGAAAFAGSVAAPFLGAHHQLGLDFLVISMIVLMIGGLGSVSGTAFAAVLLGVGLALVEAIVLSLGLSPSISRMFAVVLMIGILLVRPFGVFAHEARFT